MKRGWLAGLVLMAATGLGIWATVSESRAAFGAAVVRLCHDNVDSVPWRYGRGGGLDFLLLDRAGKRAGVSFQFEAMPQQACLARLVGGEVDGAIGEQFATDLLLGENDATRSGRVAGMKLHFEGNTPSYLVFSPQYVEHHPRSISEIEQSIATVRASASYQILERQIVTLLGKG